MPPSSAELRRGKFNAQKKADREHCCFGADHRAYSGVLGERVGGGRLVGVSALAEPRSSLHEGRELRLSLSLPHSTRYGVGAIFTRTANLVNKLHAVQAPMTDNFRLGVSVRCAVMVAAEPVLSCQFGGGERSSAKLCVLQCLPYCPAPRLNFARI